MWERPVASRRGRLHSAFLVVQVGFGFVLVIGSGLFAQSVTQLEKDAGYDLHTLVAVTIDPRRTSHASDLDLQDVRESIFATLRRHPLVERAALTTYAPLDTYAPRQFVMAHADLNARPLLVAVNFVSPDYFATAGTRMIKGRAFVDGDRSGGPTVAVVGETVAAKLWVGAEALNACVHLMRSARCVSVVGVAQERRPQKLAATTDEVFLAIGQQGLFDLDYPGRTILVKPRVAAAEVVRTLALQLNSGRNGLGIAVDVRPVSELADAQTRLWRLGATAFGWFGTLALCLSAFGLFSSLAFVTLRRTPELALRLALGASRGRILWLVVVRGLVVLCAGWLCGVVGALVMYRVIQHLLVGSVTVGPTSLVTATAVLAISGVAGCLVPAYWASRLNPRLALQTD